MGKSILKIGEAARSAGVSAKALRLYEAKGLIQAPRAENGYRLYPADAVDLLGFIKRAPGLGLTLQEIKAIMVIREGGRAPSTQIRELLSSEAKELDGKAMRRYARSTWSSGRTSGTREC